MEQTSLTSYWWIVIPVTLVLLALLFSLGRRGSKERRVFPESYIDGLRALIAGDDSTAFAKLKQAVADDTDNIDAYLRLGDLFRARGQIEKAIRVHNELTLRKKIEPQMKSLVWQSLAKDYIQANKYELALEVLTKLAKDSDYKNWALEKILEVHEKTENWDKAFSSCKNLLKSKDQYNKLAIYKHLGGDKHYNDGEFHKARLVYKDALHYDDKFAQSYIMIAESYLAEDRKQDAVEFYKKLAVKAPSEVYQVAYKMEQTMFELGQFSDVEKIYAKILEQKPDDFNAMKSLAGIAEKKGDLDGTIDTLASIINKNTEDISTAAKLVELYINKNQQDKALDILSSIKAMPHNGYYQYACPRCNANSSKPELICANCRRVGPYNRL
ncbi:MAG: tetratricopeptide repeat protein [candidate division Zixibacteria bacterium]|nr:tetratricopeptide repeat protein [candidate division Zixibacteria bacterium]